MDNDLRGEGEEAWEGVAVRVPATVLLGRLRLVQPDDYGMLLVEQTVFRFPGHDRFARLPAFQESGLVIEAQAAGRSLRLAFRIARAMAAHAGVGEDRLHVRREINDLLLPLCALIDPVPDQRFP